MTILLAFMVAGSPMLAAEITATADGLLITGTIQTGDDEKLTQLLSAQRSNRVVAISSDGGEAIAGMKLGSAIRAAGATTVLAGDCLSACVFAFVGGVQRALVNGRLGFHQVLDSESGQPISPYHPIYFNITQYVFWSGIEPTTFLQWMGFASPDQIFYPTSAELCEAGFITNCR